MKKFHVLLTGFFGCIFSLAIYASNESFLNYSAVFYFNDKDTAMMYDNIENSLNHTPDGKKSTWKNPNTSAWGYTIPSNTVKRNGTICRDLKIFNEAKKVPGMSNYTFCKIQGQWKTGMR